jgi:signal transduction histidine kinase
LKQAAGLSGFQALAVTKDGTIWSGINRKGRGLGLQQMINGSWKPFVGPGLNGEELEVAALFVDGQNTLWVGTDNQGVFHIHDGMAEHFNSADGLSGDAVTRFYEDREGTLWVSTTEGIDSFRDVPLLSFSTREGLSSDSAYSVLAAHDGTVWIGNHGSLDYLHGDKLNSIRLGAGQRVTSLFEDHNGKLWVGIDNALYVYEEGRFEKIAGGKDDSIGFVIAITEDHDHNIWAQTVGVGKSPKLIRIQDRKVREELRAPEMPVAMSLAADPNGGIWLGLAGGGLARYAQNHLETVPDSKRQIPRVTQIVVRPDGSLLGASPAGLIYWRSGTLRTLTVQNGLPCENLYSLISDHDEGVWLYAQCGLVHVPNAELQRWWKDGHTVVGVETFDVFDGARPWGTAFQPHASRSPDGRLWFANENVVQMIDPNNLRANTIVPPVHVEQLFADHTSYSVSPRVGLPALTRDLEIDYTALSFVVPQKVRFRYKLEGRDRDWQEPGTRRQAFYNDLRPGRYRFRVIASNNDGVWNKAGASLDFTILPAYYQTAWFRIACAGAVLFLLWAAYRLRVQQLGRRFAIGLEARVNERTRIARDLHDTLLQSFQGLMLRLQLVEDLLPDGKAKTQLEQTLQRADQAIAEGRRAVYDLRSSTPAPTDLNQALRTLGDEFATENSAAFHLVVEGASRDLNPNIRDELYLITREALRNAFSHARAQHVEAEITYGERVFQLRIRDDGEGIPTQILEEGRPGHYGLSGMRERAKQIGGKLELWSRAGAGTEIDISIPGSVAYRTSVARPLFSLFGRKAG